MKLIPKGWLKYQDMGQRVSGTKMIPFKVPLNEELCCPRVPSEHWFTPAILLQRHPGLKAIIDLTDTSRYYDPQEFRKHGVSHVKIHIRGGGALPAPQKLRQFFKAVDKFMHQYADDPDALVGVHCTHGLNRTGYFICHYMVDRLDMSPDDAIARFEEARGHAMHRDNFINAIKQYKLGASSTATERNHIPVDSKKLLEYSSPLGDTLHEYAEHPSSRPSDHRPQRTYANWRRDDSSRAEYTTPSFRSFNRKVASSSHSSSGEHSREKRVSRNKRPRDTKTRPNAGQSSQATSSGNCRDQS